MFKDFMKSIFSEDVDVDEEMVDENEIEEVKEEQIEEPKEEEVKVEQPKEVVVPEVKQEEVKPVAEPEVSFQELNFDTVQTASTSSSFTDLTVDEVASEDRPRPQKKSREYHYDRKKLNKPGRRKQPEIEYQAIISPIFGNQEEEQKDFSKVHDAIRLERPVDDPSFEEVISPMYGQDLPEVKPMDDIPTMDPGKTNASKPEAIDLSEMLDKPANEKLTQKSLIKE